MHEMATTLGSLEPAIAGILRFIGTAIDVLGVLVILAGIVLASLGYLRQRRLETAFDQYRIGLGRSLQLGLEVLVAADIVKTIAIDLTLSSLALLAGLIVVRTFLGWALVLEIEGRWPWQVPR
jgi:uncharacterized membrane protein